jgi:hypothetical protein
MSLRRYPRASRDAYPGTVTSKKTPWKFVDCEARGTSPVSGTPTEFGAVLHYDCAVADGVYYAKTLRMA